MPEQLAVFAVRHRGPRAARRIADLRAGHPEATPGELVELAVGRARRVGAGEGSFVGGPFVWLVPFAFCTALLEQGQLMLEIAALAGKDPTASARTAEVLVLQGAHPDVTAAERALARDPRAEPSAGRWRGFWYLIRRMARLLGITGEDEVPPPGRWRTAGSWALLGLTFLVGTVAPLVWLPYMGVSYGKATNRLADRAVAFHFGPAQRPRQTRRGIDPGVLAAGLRALLSVLLPVAAVLGILLADVRAGGSTWPVVVLVLAALSTVVGGLWYRRHRRRGNGKPEE
ncbi:hypothetical protein F7Q99_37455 [Streptomyces kaniharaensis]|uniref:Uncharacterized protein n=1 Tax=Streptomyces kaniharaensis TaxID=212423 RepID=A0A6N7L176_9ACTN|nr:hypothetical protein [Streptomyces kaniharaensis]MQS17726.1 hypothetical protein [Streptomyces kaniharaensis]